MRSLDGRRVALLETRSARDMAGLVRRLGGVPISVPAVEAAPRDRAADAFVEGLLSGRFSLVIFLSGAGAAMLLAGAARRGQLSEAVAALARTTIACRGTKPLAALKRCGLRAAIGTASPHTTTELLDALSIVDLEDRGVLLVHYGERNTELASRLRARGARLDELCPYEWARPHDVAPLARLVSSIVNGEIDAVLFTSKAQCAHLFAVAADAQLGGALALSLTRHVVVGAVGPVCAGALIDLGVTPDVIPPAPTMISLINSLADYFELTQG